MIIIGTQDRFLNGEPNCPITDRKYYIQRRSFKLWYMRLEVLEVETEDIFLYRVLLLFEDVSGDVML